MFSQDSVYAIVNTIMCTISHVIRLLCHKIDKKGEVNMAKYILSVHANLNEFLERVIYICSFFV